MGVRVPGGAPEKPDDLVLYQIDVLVEGESVKPVTAIKRIADRLGLKDPERKRFINRLRAKYPRKKKEGTIPSDEPIPPDLEAAIDSAFDKVEEQRQFLRESIDRLTAEAESYGFDTSGDLQSQFQAVRIEYEVLRDLLESPASVASAKLRGRAPESREAAKRSYLEARDRFRELAPQVECLSQLIRWKGAAHQLGMEESRRS